jgi:hypothetical protein
MGSRIVISESQYNRLFLNGVDIVDTIFINEQNKKNNIIILPGANAGEIQEFLKSKGFYNGNVDWDFGDDSVEAFAKYYRKFGPIKTIEELYDELNVMGYDVGKKTGKIFGPKMAKVISDLIKKKESNPGDKVLQTSEKCRPVCNEMTDEEFEETLNWVFPDSKNTKALLPDWKINNRECMRCHSWNHGGKQEYARLLNYAQFTDSDIVNSEKFQYYRQWNNDIEVLYNQMMPWNEILYKYRHDILDVLSVIAYFFGPIGVGISMALEAINGGLYYAEGDETSAILCWVFMAIPITGPLVRKLTAPTVKNIVKYFRKLNKIGENMSISEKEAKRMIQDLNKTLNKTEKKIVEEMTDPKVIKKIQNTNKKEAKKILKDRLKQDPELYKQYLKYETSFGKNSKFIQELLNPTMLEKFIFAGAVFGGMSLASSGKLENFGQYVTEKLVQLGWISADASVEEKQANIENYDKILDKYKNKSFGVKSDKVLKELSIQFHQELDTNINFDKKVYEYDLPAKVELINSELEQKKIILNKLKNIPEGKLRDFDNYKWAQLCKGKNKLSVSSNITPEIEEFLNDDMFNIRRIKSSDLGSDYEYASDEDGLWYFKKTGEDSWKLVTDCMALLKIETAMEKDLDSDIDTEGEVFDIYRNDVDIEYKNF